MLYVSMHFRPNGKIALIILPYNITYVKQVRAWIIMSHSIPLTTLSPKTPSHMTSRASPYKTAT